VHVPHPDLRHLARDAAIAAEVAIASIVLTGSIEAASHVSLHRSTPVGSGSGAAVVQMNAGAPAPAVVAARIDLTDGAAGPVATVRLPAGGEVTVRVLDASGVTVASLDGATREMVLVPGSYRLLASRVGPVETVGDTAIASSAVVRSELFDVATAETLSVVLDLG
jgi:hypothetical protein